MTMKPRAKKYRIRGSGPLNGSSGEKGEAGKGVSGEVSDAREVSVEQEIQEIRKEGLTGRQLRMARRVAQKHGLKATSDFDAVRLLRAKGVDPFQRGNAIIATENNSDGAGGRTQLPQTVPLAKTNLPSTNVDTAGARAKAILEVQRDIARRRRRRLFLLFTRLAFFVLLPTILVGYYFYNIATPMYSTTSQFVIQKADSQGGSKIGSLFGGTGLATSQDSITVQSYLQSRDAMLRLDREYGFKAHFSQDWIDPIQRLDPDATNEQTYRLYKRHVILSYDPTEGIVKMEVIAADPDTSVLYSNALISYAEEQVDHMTSRMRDDQMKGAEDNYSEAKEQLDIAQEKVNSLQETLQIINTEVEVALLTNSIALLEQELLQAELSLEELRSNPRPNPAKLAPLERKVNSLKSKIQEVRGKLVSNSGNDVSVARRTSELRGAEREVETRTMMLEAALQQLENSRVEANRQTRYLSMGVSPVKPDEAAYPRKFENTLLALLIFSGAYLMISLTASILREQVSS
ncbi:capsule biosynthesis protein [Profundibacter amoris]|uniref:Capsule biosynthesis protein n=1 Tax=Profundibacter amoris TaxID=2171755 RepID=A0A347UDJ3_9RHOB|nr:capsule biosynthesis protein [Profundibacter amoris]AXX96921.1 capsule biosynthesis protein [Profundibacter amoris]